jgi:hypothetical protein
MSDIPTWQLRRWPYMEPDAPAVPFGLSPREGVYVGCGDHMCRGDHPIGEGFPGCYEADEDLAKTLLLAPNLEDDEPALDTGDLAGYAAEAAAKVLVENWTQALRDGNTMANLVEDIERTVDVWLTWKAGIQSLGEPIMLRGEE